MQFLICLLLMISIHLNAQESRPPERGGYTRSLGQPMIYKPYFGFSLGNNREADFDNLTAQLRLGVYKDLLSPVMAAAGLSAEGYIGNRNDKIDGGARGFFELPVFRFAAGADYNIPDKRTDLMLRLKFNFRRGGIFGKGTDIRFEWLPNRSNTYNIALGVPIFQPPIGETRPKKDFVKFSKPQSPSIKMFDTARDFEEVLDNVKQTAMWINRLTTPYFDYSGSDPYKAIEGPIQEIKKYLNSESPLFADGKSSEAAVRLYHQEMGRAFSIAILGKYLAFGENISEGIAAANKAREIILEEVIIPYNRLLGQWKNEDTILQLAVYARGSMTRWLTKSGVIPDERVESVRYVFQQLLDIIEKAREDSHKSWKDSRLVWIPFQFALLPEQHDSQAELDLLIERTVKQNFTDGNKLWYIINEQFQFEVSRQIHLARDYHILWIHDIDGYDASGAPDTLTFLQVKESYLKALIERVREYDDTGKLPVFMIFLDQHYYELNGSRKWLRLLEKPLYHKINLSDKSMEQAIFQTQAELRKAVKDSKLLQAEIKEYGEEWLYNLIKIHVNITNPADLSFWSSQIVPILGVPDNLMRDHRKISFFDIAEEDPYRGMMMIAGMGIGEHYVGPTWDDRGVLLRGPAALDMKYAALQLLRNQGFEEQEIPFPLLQREKPLNYDTIVQDSIGAFRAADKVLSRAMQLHSQTGFHYKPIAVVKAILYSLMPKGSLQIIPDSLWNSPFWASLLLGNVLREGTVLIIAPSAACAPAPAFPQMSYGQELLARLIVINNILAEEIKKVGGQLRINLYDPEVDVADIGGMVREFKRRLKTDQYWKENMPFHPSIIPMLDSLEDKLGQFKAGYITGGVLRRPKLHAKINFFASAEQLDNLLRRPEFTRVLETYILQRADQVKETTHDQNVKDEANDFGRVAKEWIVPYVESLSPAEQEKIIFYFSVGTSNMDYRSLMMDGEAMVLISKWYSIYGLMDLIFRMSLSKNVSTLDELEELLPGYNGIQRRIGRIMKYAL